MTSPSGCAIASSAAQSPGSRARRPRAGDDRPTTAPALAHRYRGALAQLGLRHLRVKPGRRAQTARPTLHPDARRQWAYSRISGSSPRAHGRITRFPPTLRLTRHTDPRPPSTSHETEAPRYELRLVDQRGSSSAAIGTRVSTTSKASRARPRRAAAGGPRQVRPARLAARGRARGQRGERRGSRRTARPRLALELIESGQAEALVVWKLDRLSHSRRRLRPAHGAQQAERVGARRLDLGVDTTTPSGKPSRT